MDLTVPNNPNRVMQHIGYQAWITSPMQRPETYQIKPFAIKIFGDIANVFYSVKWKSKGRFSAHARALVSLKNKMASG